MPEEHELIADIDRLADLIEDHVERVVETYKLSVEDVMGRVSQEIKDRLVEL